MRWHAVFVLSSLSTMLVLWSVLILNRLSSITSYVGIISLSKKSRDGATADSIITQSYDQDFSNASSTNYTNSLNVVATGNITRQHNYTPNKHVKVVRPPTRVTNITEIYRNIIFDGNTSLSISGSISLPKFIIHCKSGCVDMSNAACLGGYEKGSLKVKRPWAEEDLDIIDQDAVEIQVIPGDVVAIYTGQSNINHALHDDLWSGLVWSHLLKKENKNFSVVMHATHPWADGFLKLFDRTFGLNAHIMSSEEVRSKILCAEKSMYLNGFLRRIVSLAPSQLLEIRSNIREMAYHSSPRGSSLDQIQTKKKVVIYTRKDSLWRNVEEVDFIVDLFDKENNEVTVISRLPSSFNEQVNLFHSADLLVAPNGGWAPNVLWMKDDACLAELHLEKEDSWIKMFGLSDIFKKNHFLALTGKNKSFSFPNETLIKRPGRVGGDGVFAGSKVRPALLRALCCYYEQTCFSFLNKELREMEYDCKS